MRKLLLAMTAALCAQEATFRATVPVVQVPVTVTDGGGKLVDGLVEEDFTLADNGRSVRFQLDTSDTQNAPVALIVIVQSNDLSAAALLKIQKVGAMIQPLITGERGSAALVAADEEVRTIQEFTSDPQEITNAFRRLAPRRGRRTVIRDAAVYASEMFRQRTASERRMILMIGESKDRGSNASLETTLQQLQRENIQLYAATYSATRTHFTTKGSERPKPSGGEMDLFAGLGELIRLGKTDDAGALAAQTGGKKLTFGTLRSLERSVARTGEDLHGQYLLTFAAAGPEGYHTISVQLRDGKNRSITARQGYWSVASP